MIIVGQIDKIRPFFRIRIKMMMRSRLICFFFKFQMKIILMLMIIRHCNNNFHIEWSTSNSVMDEDMWRFEWFIRCLISHMIYDIYTHTPNTAGLYSKNIKCTLKNKNTDNEETFVMQVKWKWRSHSTSLVVQQYY